MALQKTQRIKIHVILAGLFRIERFREDVRNYPVGITVQEVVADLKLPVYLLGIVVINDVHASTKDVLNDGDVLALFPLLDGG